MKQISWAIGLVVLLVFGPLSLPDAVGASGGGSHGGYAGRGGYSHGGHYYGHGWGTRVYIGGGWWGWPYWSGPGWWGPGYWGAPYPYYADPPVVVQQGPTEYIPQAPAPPAAPQYWYYCQKAGAYYPYVKDCPGGWMTVVPQPASPGP